MRKKNHLYVLLLFTLSFLCATAQDIKKEVTVIKPYEPILSDAVKISFMPQVTDTTALSTEFTYTVSPTVMITVFEPRPIAAAKMMGEPLPKLYKTHLKLGFGNYFTPLVELSMHNLRSKDYSMGFNLGHISSQGKIKLDNDEKVFAGYGNTQGILFGKKFFKKSVLSSNIDFLHKSVYYYGYNPDLDSISLNKEDIHQSFINVGLDAEFKSSNTDSSHLNYAVDVSYDYFADANDNIENAFVLNSNLDKVIDKQDIGMNINLQHYSPISSIDSSNNTIFGFLPWLSRHSSEWWFRLGFNTYFDRSHHDTKVHFSPCAQLHFVVVENILVPYIGVDGQYVANNYQKIALENPFIIPNLHLDNTNHKIIAYIGIKGRFSKDISFNAKASYSVIDDLYFFVNDSNLLLENQFSAVNDNAEVSHIYADIHYTASSHLSFLLKANYFKYNLNHEEQPWHTPALDMTLSAHYNLRNKILIDADIYGIGKRYAKMNHSADGVKELPAHIDLNLGMEYRYTKSLSAFLRVNNMLGSKYYFYNFYPSQGFNFIVGFTYSL